MRNDYKSRVQVVALSTLIGFLLLIVALTMLNRKLDFIRDAKAYNAPIVQVLQENVRKRKRSTLVHIPVVEITDEKGVMMKVRVDTYSESPIYRIGDNLEVIYNPVFSDKCLRNIFADKWGAEILSLSISLACFYPLLHYIVRENRRRQNQSRLGTYKRSLKKL